ncbi:uncharacterized protein LOC106155467 [Lingula anatina]|uniref:Uncharacterized protein LOC106155467 n=1 Tax=Lingula anatina TaxID=7574 RepID=A0A1S3HK10_LINAN|nr:uncharacterized protein LOC106155467 [Lingula anatina]XP_013385791.1 uncharacterized protein LOC106155467 [Lingula anatina]|eukprot:XP_013385790.1 uncharacterized protein LOC106155467 [Lingula anatina]
MAGGRRRAGRTRAQARELLTLRQRSNLIQAPASSPELYRGPVVNFDNFRRNIERSIMEDHQKYQGGLTARDLYIKSNPGLLGDADYTNPRQWYNSNSKQKLISSFLNNYKRTGIHRVDNPSNLGAVYVTLPTLARKQRRGSKATVYVSESLSKHAGLPKLQMAHSDHSRGGHNGTMNRNIEGLDERQEPSAFLTSLPPIHKSNMVRPRAAPETIDKEPRTILPEIPRIEVESDPNNRVYRDSVENENRHIDQKQNIHSNLHKHAHSQAHLSKAQFHIRGDDKNSAMHGSNASLSMAHERPALPNIKPTQELAEKYQSLREQKSLEKTFEIDRDEYRLRQKSNLNLKMKKYQMNEQQTRAHRDIHKNASPLDLSNVKSKVSSIVQSTASTPRRLSRSDFEEKNRHETETKEKTDLTIAAHRCSPSNKYDVKGDNQNSSGSKSNRSEKEENHHYVYHSKTSADGFTKNKGHRENTKAKVVVLALERDNAAAKGVNSTADITIPYKLKFDNSNAENTKNIQNDERADSMTNTAQESASPTKRFVQFSNNTPSAGAPSPTKSIKKPKSVLRKFTKLEVFSDGKRTVVDDSERFSEVTEETHRMGTAASRVPIGTPLYRLDTRNVAYRSIASQRQEEVMEEEGGPRELHLSKGTNNGQHFAMFEGPYDGTPRVSNETNHNITKANSVEFTDTDSNAQSKQSKEADDTVAIQGQSQVFSENGQQLSGNYENMDLNDSLNSVDENYTAQFNVKVQFTTNQTDMAPVDSMQLSNQEDMELKENIEKEDETDIAQTDANITGNGEQNDSPVDVTNEHI